MKKFLSLTDKTFEKRGVATIKELWTKAQEEGYEGLSTTCHVELTKAEDEQTKRFHAVFSSENEDRHGDVVKQDFDLKAFKKNPVFLDSHNYFSIEHILGRISPIGVKDGKLQGDIEFATDNPKGALAEQLAEKGFLTATSIGFIPKMFDDDGNILKSELLEISAVSVPANADALFDQRNYEPEHKTETDTEEVQDEPEEDTSTDTETVEPKKADPRKTTLKTLRHMEEERERDLKFIAREIRKIKVPVERKRKIYQSLRKHIKADNSAKVE